jgi:SAM-dependent methyltransferase
LEDARLPAASVDTVIMAHTLEHVPDPVATLREVRRVLRAGGALVLWLPNVESIEARLLGGYWIGYDAPRHLTTFGMGTLEQTLKTTGFRVVDVRHEAVGLEWAWALRLWVRGRFPAAERALRRLHPLLIVLATPLALVGAASKRSGRVRVVAAVASR